MSVRDPILPEMTAEMYLAWEGSLPEKFELHHGFAFAFAGGTFEHDQIALAMRDVLRRTFPAPCRTIGSDVKVRVAEQTFYYCDVAVVCEPVDRAALFVDRPRIVVEVLSRSTRGYDLVEKRAGYRSMPSVEAYVIVHTAMRRIEIDGRDLGGRWVTHHYDDDSAFIGTHRFELDEIYGSSDVG